MRRVQTWPAAMLAACLAATAAADAPAEAPQPAGPPVNAVWVAQKHDFNYHGFTTRYSCDGLRDKVRAILTRLGASDLKVREGGCDRPDGHPAVFPSVIIEMKTLAPADSVKAPASAPISAHWIPVEIGRGPKLDLSAGDCELLEQVRDDLLPLFSARKATMDMNCIPHQQTAGSLRLTVEVLIADPPSATQG